MTDNQNNNKQYSVESESLWQKKKSSLSIYFEPRLIAIFFLGFSSGLPLTIVLGTLNFWLSKAGIDKTTIGLFALVSIPYNLKFLWSPIIDKLQLPYICKKLGRRRGWLIFTQLLLIISMIKLGLTNPALDPIKTAWWALIVAFFSASQDIVIDAFRIEKLDKKTYAAGAAMVVFGYRIGGALFAGAGALYLSSFFSWPIVYAFMACGVSVGVITTLFCSEPEFNPQKNNDENEQKVRKHIEKKPHLKIWQKKLLTVSYSAVISPFVNFMKHKQWLIILCVIMLYKVGDAFVGNMSNPFFLELGFSAIEIANVVKLFGFTAVLVGIFLGGLLLARLGIMKGLLICGILQILSNFVFVAQAMAGHSNVMLIITMATENITSGMGTAALIAYLSSLCNPAYAATQYALLTSFMANGRSVFSAAAGWFADHVSWINYFYISALVGLPGLLLIILLIKKDSTQSSTPPPLIKKEA